MKNTYLRDQRGVAMLLELVLVASVLALVGVAVYQANNHKTASTSGTKAADSAAVGLANSAAAITEEESDADAKLSASAEASASQLSEADVDVTNLGGSSSANAF